MQARGLRKARSGLVGMIIPLHDNRFFTALSQSFEAFARERGLVPVIASSLREPEEERRIVETLIGYAVDFLSIAGATDPDSATARLHAQARELIPRGTSRLHYLFAPYPIYASHGAAAMSVLCDRHFQGSLDDLRTVRQTVSLPLLCKDFILERWQIVESAPEPGV